MRREKTADAILTGFYAAYYINGGKKAKPPNELIGKLYVEKQSLDEGLEQIRKIKEIERRKKITTED